MSVLGKQTKTETEMTKAQTIAEIKAELARLKKQLALAEAKTPKKRTVINLMSGKM
jgi:hypothetical protein